MKELCDKDYLKKVANKVYSTYWGLIRDGEWIDDCVSCFTFDLETILI